MCIPGFDMQAGQVPGAQRQRDLSYTLICGVPRLEPAKKADHETVARRERRRRHKTAVALAGKHHRAIRDESGSDECGQRPASLDTSLKRAET